MPLDLRGRAANGGVVRLQRFKRLEFGIADEEGGFQFVQLAGDVVFAVKGGVRENSGKYFLGQHMLNQHLAHIGGDQTRINRFLRVGEKARGLGNEFFVGFIRSFDHFAQRLKYGGQILLELADSLVEINYLVQQNQ